MTSLANFFRGNRLADTIKHLRTAGADQVDLAAVTSPESLVAFVKTLEGAVRDQLVIDAERVTAMTDQVGQAALVALPEWREQVLMIDGAQARANWLFLTSEEAFRQAEEIRYADENQNGRRLWDGFMGPQGRFVAEDTEAIENFRGKLLALLPVGQLFIERFERLRPRQGDPDQQVVQITIYAEDVPQDELVFAGSPVQLQHRSRKPVRETVIIYDAKTGAIDVIAKERMLRQEIAKVFAETLLGLEITGERLPPRRFDLMGLTQPHAFPTRHGDGIARVKLTRLALSSSDKRLTQIFQVQYKDADTLHEVLAEHYGDESPLDGDLYPWSARIEVELEPEGTRKRGKKINIDITVPNKCSLRGKTAKERLILEHHLAAWGLQHAEQA